MKHLLLRNAFTLKAFLLVSMIVGAASGAWAQSEKITFADLGLENGVQYTNPFDGGDFTVTFAGGANDGKYYNTGTGIRVYGGGTMTIASENYISSITITYDGTNKPTDNVANVGTYDATTGVWTGREKAIVFTRPSGSGHWRVQSIEVTYDTGGTPTCETPVISGETTFMTYTTVSISCATEGAAIQYSTSTDGENYTAYTPYSAPFQISATTQVKAKATKEGLADSKEAYKLFTQQGAIPNIGYFISSHATTTFTDPEYLLLEDALVTFKSGSTAYIKDAYRAVMLYNCASNLEAGDKINGYMKVTGYTVYNGLPEITGFELVEGYTKTSGNEVTPTVMTLAELLGGGESSPYEMYLSEFIKIENATVTSAFDKKSCTIQQGDYSIILRDQNSTATLTSNVNDIVTVTGHVAIYNDTKQIAVYGQDQIVAGEAPADPTITVTPSSLTGLTYMVEDGPSVAQTISVSGTNLTSDITLTMGDKKFEMSLTEDDGYASSLTLTPSDGAVAATTIYVRLRAGLEVNASYSGSIAIASTGADSKSVTLTGSVTEYVPDYAKLPFAFDGGKANIESTTGLTQNGLGSDYKSSPFLKFDGTGDALVLKINERPGTLTFDIKGNSFSGGTFTVQTSEDGKTYTDLESYTELGDTQNESFDNLGENVRYIKWIYTNKSDGNVAIGNINLAAYEAPSLGQISISPDTYSMDAKAGGGELPVTCTNLATDPQLAVVFVKEDGVTPQSYDWITAEINDKGNINGQILENTGEARTAYFYVQGVDANNNVVKSNLVTFTQEAPVTEPTITVNTATWEFEYTGGAKTFGFEYANLGSDPTFSVQFFESDGKTEAECGWISTQFEANDNKVTITAAANDETSARTAYFKIYAEVNKTKVYSNLVTISQKFNSDTPQISGDQFVKVNSTEELTEGEYLVVYEEAGLAFDGGLEKLDVAKNTITVTIADGAIAKTEANSAASFTISAAEGGYTIQGANGKYIGMASDGNGLSESEKEVYTNTISFETNGDANIVGSGGAYLRYNATSGQERFRYYKSSSYTNQKAIALYKLVEEPDTRLDPELSFSTDVVNAAIGDELVLPTLSAAEGFNGTVEYESSDESVAQVMDIETGELRVVGEGTTTITATFAGNDTYKGGSASYTLNVNDNRIATTTTQENIELELDKVSTLTRLAPVVKDAEGNAITYSYDGWPTEMSFEIVSDDNSLIGSLDNNTGEIKLNSAAGTAKLKAYYNAYNVNSTYKPSECTFTITVEDPSKTYYALVAQYDGKYYAINSNSKATWGATEVDAVNGKVVNGKVDAISWDIYQTKTYATFKNKASKEYLGFKSSGTDLAAATSDQFLQWSIDADNNTWTNQNGQTSGTTRTMLYNGKGFKNYAGSNANQSGYSDYTHAYTFASGYTRDVTAGNWGTFCVDHSIAAADYSGVKFYTIAGKVMKNNEPAYIVLQEANELRAGVAYIFQANEDATKLIAAYSDESIDEPISAEYNNGLAGSFEGQDVEEGKYLLSGGAIVKCGTGCSIAANRAYIDMSNVPVTNGEEAGVKLFIGGGEDGISSLNAAAEGAVIYDLSGRRVSKTTKGLYIVNGKKVSVK